jgi:hypothetical protein
MSFLRANWLLSIGPATARGPIRNRALSTPEDWLAPGLDHVEIVDLDGGGEVTPLVGAEGERRTVWVLGVADGDVVLACGAR